MFAVKLKLVILMPERKWYAYYYYLWNVIGSWKFNIRVKCNLLDESRVEEATVMLINLIIYTEQ